MLVEANPKVLVWAREEARMPIDDVAKKIKIAISDFESWEKYGRGIPFSKLESLAKLYKRQAAVFFLPFVPKKIKTPKDCRNLAISGDNFSPETMLAIRRTERYLDVMRELFDSSYWDKQYDWIKLFSGKGRDIETETKLLRELLELDIGGSWAQGPDAAFRILRKKIEDTLGIFIFQFPMPKSDLDGFSYAFDKCPYAIVVNNDNAAVRKIFTIFHELCHIFKHTSGACNIAYSNKSAGLDVELECNRFAAKFLVPTESLKSSESVEGIFRLARSWNVSGEVYLRRLLDEEIISRNTFFDLLKTIKEKSKSFVKKKTKGFPSQINISKSTRGNRFYGAVTEAAASNKISFSSAADLLGLRVNKINS